MTTQLPPNLLGVKVQLLISETEAFDGSPLEWMSMSESDFSSSSESDSEISTYSDESINVPSDQILYASKGRVYKNRSKKKPQKARQFKIKRDESWHDYVQHNVLIKLSLIFFLK